MTATGRSPRPDGLAPDIAWIAADLHDRLDVARLAGDWWGVIHLAAQSIPARYVGPETVAEALDAQHGLTSVLSGGRFLLASSCHVYAPGPETKTEASATAPAGLYGLAKLRCEDAALDTAHLDVRVGRPFNHIGPGMRGELMIPALLARIRMLAPDEPIVMTGKNSVRDFVDVRDISRAYLQLIEMDDAGERIFNICSGKARSIASVARAIADAAGRTNPIVFQGAAQSADDADRLIGSFARLKTATGWQPEITFEQSAAQLVAEAV